MIPFGILADDLTGACDCGVQFSNRGAAVLVCWNPIAISSFNQGNWDVVVIDTESRHSPAEDAGRSTVQAACRLNEVGYPLLYKKIDSTLRGNLLGELKALLNAGRNRQVIAPAFPLLGRTIENGILSVDGIPVHLTEFGQDRLTPVSQSNIPLLLEQGLGRAVSTIGADVLNRNQEAFRKAVAKLWDGEASLIVPDTLEPFHLTRIAAVLVADWESAPAGASLPLAVGSAGLARELAALLLPERGSAFSTLPVPVQATARGAVLVLAGSRTQATKSQAAALSSRSGTFTLVLDITTLPAVASTKQVRAWTHCHLETLRQAVAGGASTLLVTVGDNGKHADAAAPESLEPLEPLEKLKEFQNRSLALNHALGALAAGMAETVPLRGMVLTGGDIAMAVLHALGVSALRLGREVLPGIPLGFAVDSAFPGMALVTKAGGFGGEDALIVASQSIAGLSPETPLRPG